MADPLSAPRARCLCLDIETARHDRLALRELGVFRPDLDARLRLSGKARDLQQQLDRLTEGAAFVLGHNVTAFDQPALATLHPGLALHRLPLIDTLELSPIAFPQNPYHHLVKDYKLCTTTRNDPVRDAELAYTLFLDQTEALQRRVAEDPDEACCLHFLLAPENGSGLANFFATLRRALRPKLGDAALAWQRASAGKVCISGQRRLIEQCLPDPSWHRALAYTLTWLRVAGGNSVLPPWVMHSVPKVGEALAMLRDTPCSDPECVWCREQHHIEALLPRYFPGITRFRATPTTPDGRSLQQTIVENGFAGRSTLAILPTGGGKSLCFQLPALARYYRNGSLTVVISPLQSLMKDQVDNLEARGITCAGYLNSLLNPLERQAMLDKLRLGDLGLIFVAPEQFRSTAFTNALMHRQIGAWVFDEAHCLSKWGHDFRPDYLYVSRFIKARQKNAPSPVHCFTATAKPDVVDDICTHFEKRLGIVLDRQEGGVKRENLHYEVRPVPGTLKYGEVLRLLQDALREEGGAIVFCARQKTVEELSSFLKEAGLACGHFHGGMLPTEKRAVQEAFLAGSLRVIAATNAFGMGVDKPDVRLVIHLDTPGSLENYLQEAGRAGRDQEAARCVLLYDETDLDVQFRLLRNARLTQHDILSILKALRAIERKDRGEGEVVVTAGEILLEIPDKHRIDPDAGDADTKVRIAVAWLEEARLLERHENHTRVFPGSLLVATLDEARALLQRKLGADADIEPYVRILSALIQANDDEGLSTDDLMLITGRDSRALQNMLRELDRWKLLSNDTEIGITLYRDPDTVQRLDELARIEDALLANLREAAPDADQENWQVLNVRRLCDTLRRDTQIDFDPERLTRLLKSFAEPFGQGAAQRGFFALRPQSADSRYLKLLRSWADIDTIRARRMHLARALLTEFLRRRQGNTLLVTCKQGELEAALQADTTLADLDIRQWDSALSATLLYLDANEVLHLARGKAVFRAAMSITLNPEARRRQFKKSDYAELALHYQDKIVQVHVMAEYAKLAIDKLQAAMSFVFDYFSLERAEFVQRYFAGRKDVLEIATTEEAHRRILTNLANPDQQAIVAAPLEGNHLVLAGPGAGKTRVIVHRVAWLLRECMVLPEEIMVLAYNRSAANEIRRRLWALVGSDAAGVAVQTLHGLAMRLTGTSYAVAIERGDAVDFGEVIRQATRRLRSAENGPDTPDTAADAVAPSILRDRLLAGLRFLLVDEYQDINGDHYALISAVAGRTLQTEEDRVSLMVVGDDDQNIYAFDGASVRYIRQFESDYHARRYALMENYRSTQHIIHAANRIIEPARERMKTGQDIRIDHARHNLPHGGPQEALDTLARGRVHVLEVPRNPHQEAQIALGELKRLHDLQTGPAAQAGGQWGRFAVIARRWEDLEPIAALCRLNDIPVQMQRDGGQVHLHHTREGNALLTVLGRQRPHARRRVLLKAGVLTRWFRHRFGVPVASTIEHPYRAALAQFILDTDSAAPSGALMVDDLIESLYDFGAIGKPATSARANAPMALMTAHRAKGLEFDHVLILDGGGWQGRSDDERRLFYVAMTRARQSLTLCEAMGGHHPFIRSLQGLALRSQPTPQAPDPRATHRTWYADQEKVFLSWPGRFAPGAPIHRALAALDVGSPLELCPRSDGKGWEITDVSGVPVGRMSSKFQPPAGAIIAVRVAAILVRHAKDHEQALSCQTWELVLPEIEYRP
ncbi:RecQ family ATP-dependent DNA helicase [Parazoarcus communis]|uniref:DNA 3'-5' helicase n=1 Tax=Parazoarcus communis SWub3 = DSM 12120 TaxID=1121029 RepID=A0A323UY50_9RHOO|nr:RecQ family ATP-dependent DNA helicase [Parazoarcus communis]NMG72615.1 RecQ family ATP-dependent DNA helicase [Parazoarcus communis SWub3 = DSM 12120]PZA16136.1 RecQ family ATP-dependent DNA helicase [Azoarcus communis] [Parazoarcus communis SWub3 = DSM 12120]